MLAIVDTETTGTNEDSEAIEKAVILYHPRYGILAQASTLIHVHSPVSPEIEALTGISQGAISALPRESETQALALMQNLILKADFVVAHQASFDRNYWETPEGMPWLCTLEDFQLATPSDKRDLINIALHYGVAVTSAHRALTDCQLLAQIFDKMEDLDDRIDRAMIRAQSPTVTVRLTQTSYDDRESIKDWRYGANRFYWNPNARAWESRFKEVDLAQIAQKGCLPFSYVIVN